MVTKGQIEKILDEVADPELGISVWKLGLIYNVEVDKKGKVEILMTLTTIGCPLLDLIAAPIRQKVAAVPGVKDVEINLTFEPPWTPDRMSKEAKIQLGLN
jgi:metal-sulfur cluster biosynthetic enzyme